MLWGLDQHQQDRKKTVATWSRTLNKQATSPLWALSDVQHKHHSLIKKKKKRNLGFWRLSCSNKLGELCLIPPHQPFLPSLSFTLTFILGHLALNFFLFNIFMGSKLFYHPQKRAITSFVLSLLYYFKSKYLFKKHLRTQVCFDFPKYPSGHQCYWFACTEEEEGKRKQRNEARMKGGQRNKWKRTRGEVAPGRWTGSMGRGDWEGRNKKNGKKQNKKQLVKTCSHWKWAHFTQSSAGLWTAQYNTPNPSGCLMLNAWEIQ